MRYILPNCSIMTAQSTVAAVDADWGDDKDTWWSKTGYVILVNGSPVYCNTKQQNLIALSSGEAEYVAISACARDVSCIRKLFWEICHQQQWIEDNEFKAKVILVDSTAYFALASSPADSSRTKHIRMKNHHVQELVYSDILRTDDIVSR